MAKQANRQKTGKRVSQDKLARLRSLQFSAYCAALYRGHKVREIDTWDVVVEYGGGHGGGGYLTSSEACSRCHGTLFVTTVAGQSMTNVEGRIVNTYCVRSQR